MSRSFFLCVLLTLIITGCSLAAPALKPLKTDLPPLESDWTIHMTHSGGIMGLSRSIEILSDGSYTVVDERSNKTITKKLSESELAKVAEIVLSAEFVTPERSGPSVCADCFIYDLEIQKDGKKFSIKMDDMSMPNSIMEPLITYLRGLMDNALK